MKRIEYEPGFVFPGTQLTYVKDAPNHGRNRRVFCSCSCDGNVKEYDLGAIRYGNNTLACGCVRLERLRQNTTKPINGKPSRRHPEYDVWNKFIEFSDKRGSSVYAPWRTSFVEFAEWLGRNLGPRPEGCRLVRDNPNKGFEPGNLKWVEQYKGDNHPRRPSSYRVEAAALQCNVCPWCGKKLDGRISVDHSHTRHHKCRDHLSCRSCVRAVVHHRCNLEIKNWDWAVRQPSLAGAVPDWIKAYLNRSVFYMEGL